LTRRNSNYQQFKLFTHYQQQLPPNYSTDINDVLDDLKGFKPFFDLFNPYKERSDQPRQFSFSGTFTALLQPFRPDVPITPDLIEEYIRWGLVVYRTRTFRYQPLHFLSPFGRSEEYGHLTPSLLPLADITNNGANENCWILPTTQISKNLQVDAFQDIEEGEELIHSYHQNIEYPEEMINLETEKTSVENFLSSNDVSYILYKSGQFVPELVDKHLRQTLTLVNEPHYGYYSQFYADAKVVGEDPSNSAPLWTPSYHYLSTGFQGDKFNRDLIIDLGERDFNVVETKPHFGANIEFKGLSYDEAPIKWIIPDIHSKSFQSKIGKPLLKQFKSLIDINRAAVLQHWESNFGHKFEMRDHSFDWFGIGPNLEIGLGINALCAIEAPHPETAKVEIFESYLKQSQQKTQQPTHDNCNNDEIIINNNVLTYTHQQLDDFIVSPQQSEDYIFDKIKKRMQHTLRDIHDQFDMFASTQTNLQHIRSEMVRKWPEKYGEDEDMTDNNHEIDSNNPRYLDESESEPGLIKLIRVEPLLSCLAPTKNHIDQQQQYATLLLAFLSTESMRKRAMIPITTANIDPINHNYNNDTTTTTTTTSTTNNDQITIYQSPTLQSSICDYYNAVMNDESYINAMTNLKFYYHLSILGHNNQVLARRLDLSRYIHNDHVLQ
jgi:hypothetical protein